MEEDRNLTNGETDLKKWLYTFALVCLLITPVNAQPSNSLAAAYAKDYDYFAHTVPRQGVFNGKDRWFICTSRITMFNDIVYNVVYMVGEFARVEPVSEGSYNWFYCDTINHEWRVYKKI